MTGDPLFAGGFDWVVLAFVVVKALIGFTIVMVGVIFMIWFERKVVADMQNRIGPNRAGPWGLGQTLADGIKLIFKEDLAPDRADKLVFRLAPYLSVAPAFLTFTIVPIGGVFTGGNDGAVELFGRRTWMQVADPPIGVLFLLAMSSIAVYGIMLAEYSSIRFGMFYLAEFMNTITVSAIIVTLFLGGPSGPVLFGPAIVWGTLWFTLKLLVFLFAFVWLRATLPRYRYDQLMDLGWKRLIPLSLGWLLVVGAISVGRDAGWGRPATLAGAFAVGVLAWAALAGAIRVARARSQVDRFGELTT